MRSDCRIGLRSFLIAALALLCLFAGGGGAASVRSAPEYSVKAAYLLLFARYVTWPDSAFPTPESPIVVGVLGGDPFGKVLRETFEGSRAHGRPLLVRRLSAPPAGMECHIIFIGGQESSRTGGWLSVLRNRPILTVTEFPGALERGAIVNFVMEGNRLRYEASLTAAESAGLKIASPMLVSARRVHGKDAP